MGGQRLSSAAAAILRGIGPTPHHFGGPESTQKRLLGLQGKRSGQGLPHPHPHTPNALFGHSQCGLHCLTEQAKCQPQNPALVTVCLSVCLLPLLSGQKGLA